MPDLCAAIRHGDADLKWAACTPPYEPRGHQRDGRSDVLNLLIRHVLNTDLEFWAALYGGHGRPQLSLFAPKMPMAVDDFIPMTPSGAGIVDNRDQLLSKLPDGCSEGVQRIA